MTNYSIIIPHYNVPELLMRCLKSIPRRDDIEIIVVDDCSEDFALCKELIVATFPECDIKFYSTAQNSGPGVARNIGLDNASGKWIVFEDADDFFSDDIDTILDLCVNRSEDVVFCHNKAVMSENVSTPADDYVYEDILLRYNETGNDEELRYKHYSVWGKLFKHSFLKNNSIRFEDVLRGQDLLFAIRSGLLCRSLAVIPHVMNVITCRKGSLSRSWNDWSDWYMQYFPVHIKAMRYLHGFGVKAIDSSVYGKMYTIMKQDFNTFKFFWVQLYEREKIECFFYLMKGLGSSVLSIK